MSTPSYLEMSSDSTYEGEVPHYAYLVLRIFQPFPTEIAVLCHHVERNYMFLPGGRVGPSPLTRASEESRNMSNRNSYFTDWVKITF